MAVMPPTYVSSKPQFEGQIKYSIHMRKKFGRDHGYLNFIENNEIG